jgi:hypothetical protein
MLMNLRASKDHTVKYQDPWESADMSDNNWHSDSHNLTPSKQICSQIFLNIEKVFHSYNSGQTRIESRHNLIMILEIQDQTYPKT